MIKSGSPDCNIDRTFTSTFYFPHKTLKTNKINHIFRNPVYLAKEYKEMIDSGNVTNQTELAKIKGISRARVTQILNLLKLDKNIILKIEQIGDPMYERIFSERKLRNANKQNKKLIRILKN